ncbi:DUF839 domain-containing protein [Mesorhizobium sp. ES1-4]|uniref:DUF839 domain-containing protein n=1 Tax=Mesorhizobium sp. ES1-4 TaxID=2876627 RepID=UPI0021E246F3|nr:DUF839 domain-containing protein [Mesorhizobium sp. ES1-4]
MLFTCPHGAEATGPCFTPDGTPLFLSVQHPPRMPKRSTRRSPSGPTSGMANRHGRQLSPSAARTASGSGPEDAQKKRGTGSGSAPAGSREVKWSWPTSVRRRSRPGGSPATRW